MLTIRWACLVSTNSLKMGFKKLEYEVNKWLRQKTINMLTFFHASQVAYYRLNYKLNYTCMLLSIKFISRLYKLSICM